MTLIAILVAPLIILGVVAFALIIAFVHRVSRVTAELEAKKRPPAPAPEQEAPAECADAPGAGGEEGAEAGPDPPRDR